MDVISMMAKAELFKAGVPLTLMDEWYREIYVEPDVRTAEKEMDAFLAKISLRELMPVLAPYLIANAQEEAIWRTVDWTRKLFGVKMAPTIQTSIAASPMESHFVYEEGKDGEWQLLVNPRLLRDIPVDLLIGVVAHEVWHGYQQQRSLKWQGHSAVEVAKLSSEEKRDLMYALNNMYIIRPEQDREGYASQLVEAEAYLVTNKIRETLAQILTKAYHHGKVPAQMLIALNSTIGKMPICGRFC